MALWMLDLLFTPQDHKLHWSVNNATEIAPYHLSARRLHDAFAGVFLWKRAVAAMEAGLELLGQNPNVDYFKRKTYLVQWGTQYLPWDSKAGSRKKYMGGGEIHTISAGRVIDWVCVAFHVT